MAWDEIAHQLTSAAAGLMLGILTAVWLRGFWRWNHPSTIRFWGSWYTDPRLLAVYALALAAGWMILFVDTLN
jgi:hypothetical protein